MSTIKLQPKSVTPSATQPAVPARNTVGTTTSAKASAKPQDSFTPGTTSRPSALIAAPPRVPLPGEAEVNAVRQKQGDYDRAKQNADAEDQQLSKELNTLGPALTGDQRKAYVDAFHKKYADVYSAVTRTAKALADEVKKDSAGLKTACANGQASAVYDVLKDLAASPSGKTAVEFMHDVFADPGSAAAQAIRDGGFDVKNDILVPGTRGLVAQALVDNDGNLSDAIASVKGQLDTLLSVPDFKDALAEVKEGFVKLGQITTVLSKRAPDRFEQVKQILKGEATSSGPMERVIGALGLASALEDARETGSEGDYLGVSKSLADLGQGGVDMVKDNAAFFSDAMKQIGVATDAEKVASVAEKLVPWLGLAANGLATAIDIQKLTQGSGFNAGDGVTLLGDMIATMGSAITLIPGGQVPGEIVDGIGTTVSIGGQWISDAINLGSTEREQRDLLDQVGVGSRVRDALATSSGTDLRALSDAGLSVSQIQDLLTSYPQLADGSFHDAIGWLVKMQSQYFMSSDNLDTLINRVASTQTRDDQGNRVTDYKANLQRFQENMNRHMEAAEEQNADHRSDGELMRSVVRNIANGAVDDSAHRDAISAVFDTVQGFLDEAGVPADGSGGANGVRGGGGDF